jgi:hypothetical protein
MSYKDCAKLIWRSLLNIRKTPTIIEIETPNQCLTDWLNKSKLKIFVDKNDTPDNARRRYDIVVLFKDTTPDLEKD